MESLLSYITSRKYTLVSFSVSGYYIPGENGTVNLFATVQHTVDKNRYFTLRCTAGQDPRPKIVKVHVPIDSFAFSPTESTHCI